MSTFFVTVSTERLRSALIGMPGRLRAKLATVIQRLAIKFQAHVKEDKLSGQVLNVRTGTLRRSINQRVTIGASRIFATVGTNVEYAGIHEYGGVIPAHTVVPVRARALRFMPRGGSEFIFRMRAEIPDVVMPERSFLRSVLREMEGEIQSEITRAAEEVLSGG